MLIPHLHFCGNCQEAIAMYEKAFNTKPETIVRNRDYVPDECKGDNRIAHAVMYIHGQKVFLNDRFGNKEKSLDCAVHLIVVFKNVEELIACYEFFKEESMGRSLWHWLGDTVYRFYYGIVQRCCIAY